MSEVIAERYFRDPESEMAVVARVFAPRQTERPSEWSCKIEVEGLDACYERDIIGVDSFQALFLALRVLCAHLEKHEHRLTHLDGPVGDCGLPIVIPWDFGPSGKADIYRFSSSKARELLGIDSKS